MIGSNVYNNDKLCKILHNANKQRTSLDFLNDDNSHVKYFKKYLGPSVLDAKFYIEENEYLSIDYSSDFSYYYSKHHFNYENKCIRLHFFTFRNDNKAEFDLELLAAITKNSDESKADPNLFWDINYLGFIVVRPIPQFLIGYTILRPPTYNKKNQIDNNVFWGVKDYNIHLFGSHIKLNSLAFLSQDSNVSACATIAIWCVLQRAVENYFINLKSPYEITKIAGLSPDGARIFPSAGLDIPSVCNVISKCNLAPELRQLDNDIDSTKKLKKYINAYSRIKLPIILAVTVYRDGDQEEHAVAICGHKFNNPKANHSFIRDVFKSKDPVFKSDYITDIYIHDDQWGPFSELNINNNEIITPWTTNDSEKWKLIGAIIPLFEKITITYEDIEDHVIGLNKFMLQEVRPKYKNSPTWDIQLYFSSDYKKEVQSSGLFDINNKDELGTLVNLMKESLPQHIWVVKYILDQQENIHFIYDASGLRQTNTLLFAFSYYPNFINRIKESVTNQILKAKKDKETKENLRLYLNESLDVFLKKLNKINK